MRLPGPITAVFVQLALGTCVTAAWPAEGVDNPAAIERIYRSGQTTLAFQRIDKALAAQPQDSSLRFLRALMLSDAQRSAEARTEYERLTQDFPELPEPFNNLAVIEAGQGRLGRARDLLETALRNDPAYLTAHMNLGDVYARLAVRAFEAAASAPRVDDALLRKLRMARELVGTSAARP
ncbi:MAG: tetratricopeptide repeat protein [Ideonella sp.]|nr:tetratricopeptide repeat protein [Ideonella sp.]